MKTENLLEVEDLMIAFGQRARRTPVVRGVSFTLRRGESLAVVGESGSGKTITSLAIIGLIGKGDPNQEITGSIRFAGADGAEREIVELDREDMRALQGNEIAMIFQEPMTSLNPVLRVGEQIAETIIRHCGKSRSEAWRLAVELLEQVGIPEAARRVRSYPHELSGGMRQRVMIAIALSCNPSLLIADEPTTALDVTIQAQILDLVARLKRDFRSSILFITHDLGVVREIADRVIVMYAGRVVEEGATADVIDRPLHPYTQGLIACIPHIREEGEEVEDLVPIPGDGANPADPPPGCAFHPRCSFSREDPCAVRLPEIEDAGDGHKVRCHFWREIGAGSVDGAPGL